MTRVLTALAVSVDGYIAGPNDGPGNPLGDGGGTVTLATGRTPDGDVCLTIADTGRGMTREQLDRAFDVFDTTKPGGTGLGLTIVRRLVTDLHGSLKVDTAPGAGTRVTVTCPRAPNGAT